MALALGDLFDLYGSSVATQKFGPDWREKLAAQQADLEGKRASLGETQARTKNIGVQTEQNEFDLERARSERKALEALVAAGKLPASELKALDALHKQEAEKRAVAEEGRKAQEFSTKLATDQADLANKRGQFAHDERMARIRAENAGSTSGRFAMDPTTGTLRWFTNRELSGGADAQPLPTAEMRNTEFQGKNVEPAFDLVEHSLNRLEGATGGMFGGVKGLIPGTQAYFARDRFVDQAKALLGAIVATQAGEKGRLSDEDRAAYSQASTIVENSILLPGGIKEARERLGEARKLLREIQMRRAGGAAGAPPPNVPAPPPGFRIKR